MTKYTITAVLTCHNRKEKTLNCVSKLLLSAERIKDKLDFHIVVCDDNSYDGTREALMSQYPSIIVVQGNGELFWARGMATAMKAAEKIRTDFFLMVNDDVDFDLDVLSVMLNDFERANDSLCAIVGSTHDSNGNHSYGGIHWNGKAIGEISEHIVPNGELQLCEQTNWNCFMIPVGLYNLIGKIDDFYEHSAADYDYSNRITKAGYKIYVASKYIGCCNRNSKQNTWMDTSLSFKQRWQLLHKKTGIPFRSNWHYCRKYYGVFAGYAFMKPYIGLLLSSWRKKHESI